MANHHDRFFKSVYAHLGPVRGQIKAVLPPELVKRLDLSQLTPEQGTFVDEELAEFYTDRLFSVKLDGHDALCYVLIEHQSTEDGLMSFRLLVYLTRIWADWLKRNPGSKKLPAILPLVVYQGPEKWSAPTEFLDLIDLPSDLLEIAREYLPSFRFALDDLSLESDAKIRQREGGTLGNLALLLLRHARDGREALLRFLLTVADLINALENREDRVLVFSYILRVSDATAQEVQRTLGSALEPETKESIVTAAEQLLEQGRLEGVRRTLLRQLRKRFQSLPSALEKKIAEGTEADLELWTDRVIDAATLEDVFADAG